MIFLALLKYLALQEEIDPVRMLSLSHNWISHVPVLTCHPAVIRHRLRLHTDFLLW